MSLFNMEFFRFFGFKIKPKAPWKKYYTKSDMNLKINDTSLYDYLKTKALKYGDLKALEYYGTVVTFKQLLDRIDECAKSFKKFGIRHGDVVTICMPNTIEGIISVFALNKIGAISNMVHPLASENEIKDTLIKTGSVMLVLIDMDYSKVKCIIKETSVYKVVVVTADNSMPFLTKIVYRIFEGRKIKLPKKDSLYVFWNDFIKIGSDYAKEVEFKGRKNTPAVMLHSGGTIGTPKAIVLSNGNFIALAKQAKISLLEAKKGDKCLSIMPIFHGFGLGVCIYTPLCMGIECILIPRFKGSEFFKLLNKHKPQFVVGVPTLFESMLKMENTSDLNLGYIKYVISGGDTLKPAQEEKVNEFLRNHGANTSIIQGYGMSESLAAVILNRKGMTKPGSVGIPLPGCYVGIFNHSDEEVPYGEEGEICICGPNVMLGYYNNERETNVSLHIHKDGNVWLHSGDLGIMDENGFVTFTNRLKRMIISSGYNVYPNQIESLLELDDSVMACSVIGVPHPYKMEVPKAYIVLNKGYRANEALINKYKEMCKINLPKYAWPVEYEFRKSLPKTLVGKVDFKKLQEENNEKRKKENEKN